jgi:spore photoproduct lyase
MLKDPDKKGYDDTEVQLDRERARTELEENIRAEAYKEYQRMVSGMREQVLNFLAENPGMSLAEAAEQFGTREHTIRAWKAHCTMGTYDGKQAARKADPTDEPLLALNKKKARKSGFVLRKRHTAFIHYFDKTPQGIVCPHFYILAFANGCPFECQYCYLNLTLRHWPEPTVFSNTARMFQEVRDWLYATRRPSVLNSGELGDSLVWDREIKLTESLGPLFAGQTRHKLLLLTKSANVSELLKLKPSPQIIVSFSVNAPEVSAKYEKKAPAPGKRLASAKALKLLGWTVRLRLDPVIPVPGWREIYKPIIDDINSIQPETVTLGSLRFFPSLRNYAKSGSDIFSYGVDERDPDGRWRVPFDQRLEMYAHFIRHLSSLRIGLCKETRKMHESLGVPLKNQACNCSYD